NLGPLARAVGEDVKVAGERIAAQTLGDESGETIEARAEIGGSAVGVDGDLARAADHARPRRSATSVASSRPSTRTPCGVTSTERPDVGATGFGVAVTETRRRRGRDRGAWSQSRNASGRTPR